MTKRSSCRSVGIAGVVLSPFLAACHALADPGIEYCDRGALSPENPYVEPFDEFPKNKCWAAENTEPDDIAIGESDVVIGHTKAAAWDGAPPSFVQRLEGNFIFATKVEAVSGSGANFCGMNLEDAAGIIVKGGSVDASLLVRPTVTTGEGCKDDAIPPSAAIVEARTTGGTFALQENVGDDGEADIAVCRSRKDLVYYYRRPVASGELWGESWERIGTQSDDVGTGPLDVGLVTTLSQTGVDDGLSVEGHFNWVLLFALTDDCPGLEDVPDPEPE